MDAPQFQPAARRAAMLEGGLSAAWTSLAGGVFLAGFAVELGAGNIAQGFLAALPFLAGMAQIAGAYFIEERGASRRTVALSGLVLSRLAFFMVIPVALWLLPGRSSQMFGAYIALASAAYLLHGFANVAWLSWMGELVPDGQRGRFFGMRNLAAGFVTVAVTALCGQLAAQEFPDTFPRHTGYLIVFGIAAVCGLAGAGALLRVGYEPPVLRRPRRNFLRSMTETLRKKDFRRFLVFHLCWMSAVYLSSPFFQFYFLQDLKLDVGTVALTNTVATIGGLTTIRLWGSLCDRFGSKPVLYVTLAFAANIPLIYVFTDRQNIVWVAMVMQGLSGVAWAGISLAASNLLLKISPREQNSIYLSTFGALSGLATAMAPILSGFILNAAQTWSFDIGGLHIYHFKIMFLASFVARWASVLLLIRIPEPNEQSPVEVVKALGNWRTLWAIAGLELVHTSLVLPIQRRWKGKDEDGKKDPERVP